MAATALGPKLRHRIDIQDQQRVLADGEYTLDWVDVVTAEPASVEPVSGKQWIASQATQNSVDTRIVIRWRSGIKARMRVKHAGNVYDVQAVLPDKSGRRWITMMCVTGVSNDGT